MVVMLESDIVLLVCLGVFLLVLLLSFFSKSYRFRMEFVLDSKS
jgi:hypothetical protein